MRYRRKRRDRAGYALVLFFMLLFGMLGLAALVIDMGFARLAQTEMQSVTDTAALEGLSQLSSPAGAGNPDGYRRQQAAAIASQVFIDPSGSASYGAGPVVDFSGGVGDPSLAASQLMTPASPPTYQPSLQTNDVNATNGDMVAGAYGFNPAYDASQIADEDDNYNRRDFTPSTGTAASSSTAFLVRTRRTNDTGGLDQEAGISFSGPTLPFLFGRGSLLARSGAANQLSVSSGITVRATAIAGPQPAKSVGPTYVNSGGTLSAAPQLAPFALRNDIWPNLIASGGTAASITINPLAAGSGAVVLDNQFRLKLTAIAQPLVTTLDESALLAGPQPTAAYVPIYADYNSQGETIVGFVYYTNWSFQGGTLTLSAPDTTAHIGGQNVSAAMVLPLPAALAPADTTALFQTNTTLSSQHPLFAPALVDRHLGPTP